MRRTRCTSAGPKYSNARFYEDLNARTCQDQSFNKTFNEDCLETDNYKNKLALFKLKCSEGKLADQEILDLLEILKITDDSQTFTENLKNETYRTQLVHQLYELLKFSPVVRKEKTNLEKLRDLISANEAPLRKRLIDDTSYDFQKNGIQVFETALLNTDPTVSKDYIVWSFESYAKGTTRLFEDLRGRLGVNLKAYVENREHLPPLETIEGLTGLEALFEKEQYSRFGPQLVERPIQESTIAQETTILYEDPNVLVVKPLSEDASIYWGRGTKWCTARNDEHNMFTRYSSPSDPLYIIINKRNPKEKYQLHRSSEQYMDRLDRPQSFEKLAEKFPSLFGRYQQRIYYFLLEPSIHEEILDVEELTEYIEVVLKSKIFELNLSERELETVPEKVFTFTQLRELFLEYNKLTLLPPTLGNLVNVKQLDLNTNKLTHLPREIGNLRQLETLDLSYNQLTSLPLEIGNLTALSVLNLSNNLLSVLPAEIGNLQELVNLDVSKNQLSSLPAGFYNLSFLTNLQLSHNKITSLSTEIRKLESLESLNMSNNELETIPKEIEHLRKMKTMNFSQNRVTVVPPEIATLPNLRSLNMFSQRNERVSMDPATVAMMVRMIDNR
jgi:hypothetical protein